MRTLPPTSLRPALVLLAFVGAGCGRFGIDELTRYRAGEPATENAAESTVDGARGDEGATIDEFPTADVDASLFPSAEPDSGVLSAGPATPPLPPPADAGVFVPPGSGPTPTDASVPSDAAAAPPPLGLCELPTNLLACTDFEAEKAGAPFSFEEYQGSVDTSSGVARASVSTGSSTAAVQTTLSPLFSRFVYTRFKMYVPSSTTLTGVNFASVGKLNVPDDFGIDLRLVNGGQIDLYTKADDLVRAGDGTRIARNRWLCVSIAVGIHDSTGQVTVDVDGRTVLNVSGVDTLPASGVEGVSAGIDWTFDGQGAATLSVDDVVVARDPLGACL